jgi:hypothetical protein
MQRIFNSLVSIKDMFFSKKNNTEDIPTNLDKAIVHAAKIGDQKTIEELVLNHHIDPSVDNNQAIQAASANGHLRVVHFLLQDPRVDPTVGNNNALQEAAYYGHLDVVERLLLDARVDPTASENGASGCAYFKGHSSIVVRLSKDPRVARLDRMKMEGLQKKTIHELRRMMHEEKMTDMNVKSMKKAEMIDYLKHIVYHQSL